MEEFWKTNFKDAVQTCQSIVVIVGVVVAVILYYRRRKPYPRLNLSQEVEYVPLTKEKSLIRVKLEFENKGEILVQLGKGFTRLQQIAPIISSSELDLVSIIPKGEDPVKPDATEIEWPLLKERNFGGYSLYKELEPGEIEELHIEFIIDASIETLLVYSFVENQKKRKKEVGWQRTTLYKVPKAEVEDTTNNNLTGVQAMANSNGVKKIVPDPDTTKGSRPKPRPAPAQPVPTKQPSTKRNP